MATDNVNSPAHYTDGNIETIDYIVDVLGEYDTDTGKVTLWNGRT